MVHESGVILDGRYKIRGVIGSGGFGVVYRAEDTSLGSEGAIKCLHAQGAREPGLATRLQREARAMGALSGTAAAQVLAFNKAAEGDLYIVMEYLDGVDLEQYLRAAEASGQILSVARMFELLAPIADTLTVAHDRGLIH